MALTPSHTPPTRKHSLNYILSPMELARDAPDVPNVTSPTATPAPLPSSSSSSYSNNHNHTHNSSPRSTTRHTNGFSNSTHPNRRHTPKLSELPKDVLAHIALHLVIDDNGNAGTPAQLLPLLFTCRSVYEAICFDNNPVLYNRLFRATFDLGGLIRRTQWMFDVKTDVPGTSKKTELFANPRSWAIEYRDRWALQRRMRICIAHQVLNVPGVSNRKYVGTDLWALWFLWTENDQKNLKFLTERCKFQLWIMLYYTDDMLRDSLKAGWPLDTAEKALGIWCASYSGADLFGEVSPAEVDEKIFMMRPYVFACFNYEMCYGPWQYKKLPLCASGCKDHKPLPSHSSHYNRFGHSHLRAPPHFSLGAYLCFLKLLERHPERMGLKTVGNTFFQGEKAHSGLFASTHIMPSLYHDTEWQRNTTCQDPHTSPGLPPLTYYGRIGGFWRGQLLFYDFDSYRQMLSGNHSAVYTGTFSQHAVELELRETVIRVREEDVGGSGPVMYAGFPEEDREEDQAYIRRGYGHQVLTGDEIYAREEKGWTKEILLSGGIRSSWGWSRVRGRIRAWDGLMLLSVGHSQPHAMGQWVWRAYINTGGYLIGRWRDTFTPLGQKGYEGPLGCIRSGDLFYPPHFPTSMAQSRGVSPFECTPSGSTPGPAPGGIDVRSRSEFPLRSLPTPPSRSGSGDDPMDGSRKRRSETNDVRWPKRQGSGNSNTSDWDRERRSAEWSRDWGRRQSESSGRRLSVSSTEWGRRPSGDWREEWPRRQASGGSGEWRRDEEAREREREREREYSQMRGIERA